VIGVALTKGELEKENARLWEKLEAIYDELHELFKDGEEEPDEEE
jgi:hypothetical protein